MPAAPTPDPAEPKEPSLIGCLIPIVAVTVLLSFGTCVVVTGYTQNQRIAEFADEEPLNFENKTPDPARIGLVQAKLNLLEDAAKTGTETEIALTADDLNTLIATQDLLESLRSNTLIEAIQPIAIIARKSQEIRKLGGGSRYLNGKFLFKPEESETNEWQLMLQDIQIPDKEVPPEFVNMFRELHMFRFDQNQKAIQLVLERITEMRLEEGQILIVIGKP